MFKKQSIKEQSIKQALSEIAEVKRYVETITRDIMAFKREIRNDIINLECKRGDIANLQVQLHDLEEKHNEATEANGVAIEQLKFDVGNLSDRYRQLDKWDDETRDKFRALLDYFGISFTEGRRVVSREGEDANQ